MYQQGEIQALSIDVLCSAKVLSVFQIYTCSWIKLLSKKIVWTKSRDALLHSLAFLVSPLTNFSVHQLLFCRGWSDFFCLPCVSVTQSSGPLVTSEGKIQKEVRLYHHLRTVSTLGMNEELIRAIQTRQQTDGMTLSYIINPLITFPDGQQCALKRKKEGAADHIRFNRCSVFEQLVIEKWIQEKQQL